jgi:hypothetical protein
MKPKVWITIAAINARQSKVRAIFEGGAPGDQDEKRSRKLVEETNKPTSNHERRAIRQPTDKFDASLFPSPRRPLRTCLIK